MKKNTKQEIIDKFAKLMIEKDIHVISIRDIAKLCNVTPATIYKHFDSKKELLITLFLISTQKLALSVDLDFSNKESAKKSFFELYKYSLENQHLFKLLLNLNQCNEISSQDAKELIDQNCLIKQKLSYVIEIDFIVEYLILFPFIKYCIENTNSEEAKVFIECLVETRGVEV